jgi:hypothetical protein
VIFYGYFGEEPFLIYGKAPIVEISGVYDQGGGSALSEPNIKLISHFSYPHVWVVLNRETGELFNRSKQWNEIKTALLSHYFIQRTDKYYKVSVMEFSFRNP